MSGAACRSLGGVLADISRPTRRETVATFGSAAGPAAGRRGGAGLRAVGALGCRPLCGLWRVLFVLRGVTSFMIVLDIAALAAFGRRPLGRQKGANPPFASEAGAGIPLPKAWSRAQHGPVNRPPCLRRSMLADFGLACAVPNHSHRA